MLFDLGFVKKLKQGDKKSFEKLFLNLYPSLCEYSVSITRSKEASEGVVQDVFAAIWQKREHIDEDVNIQETTILNPGEVSIVESNKAPTPARQANIDPYIGWINQQFVFEDTPLKVVPWQMVRNTANTSEVMVTLARLPIIFMKYGTMIMI